MQRNPPHVQMQQSANGRWIISHASTHDELASFDDVEQCVDFACRLEREHGARIVQEETEQVEPENTASRAREGRH